MGNRRGSVLLFAGLLAVSTAAAPACAQDSTFKIFWKDGIRAETADGDFKWKLGGQLQYDAAFFLQDKDNQTSYGGMHDGSEFRRARLEMDAIIYQRFIFKTQYDFAGGSPSLKDAYIGVTAVPWLGRIRIGQTKEYMSLEQVTSSKYIEFMERSLVSTFAPDRNPGINFNNSFLNDRMTYGFGVFRNGDDTTGNSGGDGTWALTGRLTGLPWYEDENKLLHIGASARYTDVSGTIRYASRPESRLARTVADTNNRSTEVPPITIDAKFAVTAGPELAFVYGPLSVQSEYLFNHNDAASVDDPDFHAYYVYATWWITGESRKFKPELAEFDRVKPKRNLLQSGGFGAWQVGLRYSYLDLTDGDITGGKVADVTAGINWHWNPNMKLMFNYVHSETTDKNDLDGSLDIFQMRAHVDF
jgi:phosphate-selective porin OprO/OprP